MMGGVFVSGDSFGAPQTKWKFKTLVGLLLQGEVCVLGACRLRRISVMGTNGGMTIQHACPLMREEVVAAHS